jgi:hypothetical protein
MFPQNSQLVSIRVLVHLSFYKGELCRLAFESLPSNFIIKFSTANYPTEDMFRFCGFYHSELDEVLYSSQVYSYISSLSLLNLE